MFFEWKFHMKSHINKTTDRAFQNDILPTISRPKESVTGTWCKQARRGPENLQRPHFCALRIAGFIIPACRVSIMFRPFRAQERGRTECCETRLLGIHSPHHKYMLFIIFFIRSGSYSLNKKIYATPQRERRRVGQAKS